LRVRAAEETQRRVVKGGAFYPAGILMQGVQLLTPVVHLAGVAPAAPLSLVQAVWPLRDKQDHSLVAARVPPAPPAVAMSQVALVVLRSTPTSL